MSELIPFARVSSNVTNFNSRNKILTAKSITGLLVSQTPERFFFFQYFMDVTGIKIQYRIQISS